MKEFDGWNLKKRQAQESEQNRWCKPRDIWWCQLWVNVGYEQDGRGKGFLRLVVILKNFKLHTAYIVPLSTRDKKNPYYFPVGLVQDKNASAILTQIRLANTKRLVEKVGKLDRVRFETLKEAIKALL